MGFTLEFCYGGGLKQTRIMPLLEDQTFDDMSSICLDTKPALVMPTHAD